MRAAIILTALALYLLLDAADRADRLLDAADRQQGPEQPVMAVFADPDSLHALPITHANPGEKP